MKYFLPALKRKFLDIKKGLFPFQEAEQGWFIRVKGAEELLAAARRIKQAGIADFDCFCPFPVHGLDQAMGLSASTLPAVTLAAGLIGCLTGVAFIFYVMVWDWPQNYGGKPYFAWPAFVPIFFEMSVLFAALATVIAFINRARLGKTGRKIHYAGQDDNTFSIWIGADMSREQIRELLGELIVHSYQVNDSKS